MKQAAGRAGLALALAAVLGGCAELGSIGGRVVVGPGAAGRTVVALLFEVRSQVDPADPGQVTSRLFLVQQSPLGVVASAAGGELDFLFHSLPLGTYVVGAYVDRNGDRDITVCVDDFVVDEFETVRLVAGDGRQQRRDVHLLRSAPERATVRGTVHLSERARPNPISLLALDGPLNAPATRVLAAAPVCGEGRERAFTFFNVPAGPLHLVAVAQLPEPDGSADLYGIHAANPLTAAAGAVLEEVAVWLDAQAPDLGALSGELRFNAPVQDARVQLLVYDRDPTPGQDEILLAVVQLRPASGAVTVPFAVPSLRLGPVRLGAFLRVREGETVHRAVRLHRTGDALTRFTLTPEAPHERGIEFPLGVGRVSGEVRLENAPANLRRVFITASIGANVRELEAWEGRVENGTFVLDAPYVLFGLDDGLFDMTLIPDVTGDGWVQDELDAGYFFPGSPAQVEILGGSRAGSDFRLRLGGP